MKKIYQEPSVECTRIIAEAVMDEYTGIGGGKQDVVYASYSLE